MPCWPAKGLLRSSARWMAVVDPCAGSNPKRSQAHTSGHAQIVRRIVCCRMPMGSRANHSRNVRLKRQRHKDRGALNASSPLASSRRAPASPITAARSARPPGGRTKAMRRYWGRSGRRWVARGRESVADGYRFLLTGVKSVRAGVLGKGSVWPIGAGNHARHSAEVEGV